MKEPRQIGAILGTPSPSLAALKIDRGALILRQGYGGLSKAYSYDWRIPDFLAF